LQKIDPFLLAKYSTSRSRVLQILSHIPGCEET
jgi:hypothetical protein